MLFVILMNFTEQGVRNVKNTVERAKAFKEMAESKYDVKVKEILWTLGKYDLIAIIDALNEEKATALALSLGILGNVKTQTLRAFTAQEMSSIIAKIA